MTTSLFRELLTPAGLADPYPVYERFRPATAPGTGSRLLLDHGGVRAGLLSRDLSSARLDAVWRPLAADAARYAPARRLMDDIVVFQDPPAHGRLRGLLLLAFTRPHVERVREVIAEQTHRLLDRLVAAPTPDLHAELSFPLPAIIVAHLLGIPDEDRPRFERWARDLVLVTGSGALTGEVAARFTADVAELRSLMTDLIAARRRAPASDLLSAMVAAVDDEGRHLTEDEVIANSLFLMTAGHETATNQLSNGMLALLRHPEQAELLRESPELVDRAVDEILRYDSAVQITARVAVRDAEIAGRRVRSGETVVMVLGAANRDPAAFDDPFRFDVRRPPKGALGHAAFGYGAHRCLGAALAREELRVAVPIVLRRFPHLRLASEAITHQPTLDFRGPERLEVAW